MIESMYDWKLGNLARIGPLYRPTVRNGAFATNGNNPDTPIEVA